MPLGSDLPPGSLRQLCCPQRLQPANKFGTNIPHPERMPAKFPPRTVNPHRNNAKIGISCCILGYLLPLFLMLSTLLLVDTLTKNELTAGIFSIIILVPYYLALFLNQKYFNQKFNFKILEK